MGCQCLKCDWPTLFRRRGGDDKIALGSPIEPWFPTERPEAYAADRFAAPGYFDLAPPFALDRRRPVDNQLKALDITVHQAAIGSEVLERHAARRETLLEVPADFFA